MDRAAALSYLQNQFDVLAEDVGQVTTDTAAGYGPAIDNALRLLGTGESDLATADVTSSIVDYMELLEYFALKRFVKILTIKFNVTLPGGLQAQQKNLFDNVKALLDQATALLKAKGYLTGGIGIQYLDLDYTEPYPVY